MGAWQKRFANDHGGFTRALIELFRKVREEILSKSPVRDRVSIDGEPLTNYVRRTADGGTCKSYVSADRIIDHVERDFVLLMKSPVIYTAVLPTIVSDGHFKVLVIIRDPLATLLSWNSVNFPISKGRLPAGELYWPKLREVGDLNCTLFERQARIWELFASRYLEYQDSIILLRYEDLVAHQFAVVDSLKLPRRAVDIKDMNRSPAYNVAKVSAIREALAKYSPTSTYYYP